MTKLKSKSSAKKRFKVTATGKILAKFACKSHFLRRRSKDMKRSNRGTKVLSKGDTTIVRRYVRA